MRNSTLSVCLRLPAYSVILGLDPRIQAQAFDVAFNVILDSALECCLRGWRQHLFYKPSGLCVDPRVKPEDDGVCDRPWWQTRVL